ncbi:hypothetical protein [Lacrimispora sp.]|uniref:hypothetical protein n=1 Tax=Lacrimispora sp. TaxID=2719234 RepID=UPI00345F47BC
MNYEKQNMYKPMWENILNTGLMPKYHYEDGEYNDELFLNPKILGHGQIMSLFPPNIIYKGHCIELPFAFPNCLLNFLIYKKELYYREDVFSKPIKVESAEELANMFGFTFVVVGSEKLFIDIFDNIIYFLKMPEKIRLFYETEAWKLLKPRPPIIHANPEDCISDDALKTEITYILKAKDMLGDYYIKNGISPFLKDFLFSSYKLKHNLILLNETRKASLFTPFSISYMIEQNGSDLLSYMSSKDIYKKLHSYCAPIRVTKEKTFNLYASNRAYEVSNKDKKFDFMPLNNKKYALAPGISWEEIRLLEFKEIESLLKTNGQGETSIADLCMLFSSIRLNKYELKYFVFQIQEGNIQLFYQFIEILSKFIVSIEDVSSMNELLFELTSRTLDCNKLLFFNFEKTAKESLLEKLKTIIRGAKIDFQYFPDKWSYSYTNSSTVCLIDNGNIDIDRLNELCTPYKCQAVPIKFTKSLLEELLRIYSSASIEDYYKASIDFFLLLCSFYDFKTPKKEDKPSVGKDKVFKDFIDTYCIFDAVKDKSSKLWIYAEDLYSAYSEYNSVDKTRYKPSEFKNKIFEMAYADKSFYEPRHTITPEGKNRNGRVYYGIQLRQLDEVSDNKEDTSDLSPSDNNNLLIENIYSFYKQKFMEIQTFLK